MTTYQPATGSALALSEFGRTLSFEPASAAIVHDWQVSPFWHARSQQWGCTVLAGYVNHDAPIWRATVAEQAAFGRDFALHPFTSEPWPSAVANAIDVPLYYGPVIPLRAFHDAGDGVTPIPPLLLRQGANSDLPREQRRQLRAIDLILHMPRAALASVIVTGPGLLTGETLYHQALTTRDPAQGDVLRVYAGNFAIPSPPTELDALDDSFTEQAYDELKVATVYLMSPRGAADEAQPDGTWVAAVKHDLFWPLSWIPAPLFRAAEIASVPNAITGLTGIGNALVAPILNTFSSVANDLVQQVLDELQAKSQAGTWWTPTGGGHVFTPAPIVTGKYDPLDKAARAKALARAKAQASARAQVGLDPVYPFTAIGFDPQRFDV